MRRIRITWVGCHSEGESAFQSLLEKGYELSEIKEKIPEYYHLE